MATDEPLLASWRRLAVIGVASVFGITAYSQSSITPPAGDPQVFYIFLNQAHRAVVDLEQAASSRSAEEAAGMARRTASRLSVGAADLPALENVYQSATSALESIDAEGRAYVQAAASQKQARDMTKLREFDKRRRQALEQARAQLRSALGEAAWLRLQAYLDGEFRMRVKRRGL